MSETRGILVTHGVMAAGMIDAVQRISGAPDEALVAVSNEGRAPEQLQADIVEAMGEGPVVIFTDLGAGSCTLAARLSCADRARVAVVTGVNLPMLLDFVFHRADPLDQLAERMVEKGRSGVRLLTRPHADGDRPVSR
jgi:mannose/fructose-specific phosphotransferase system component IIA